MRFDHIRSLATAANLDPQVVLDVLYRKVKNGSKVHYLPRPKSELYSMLYKHTGDKMYLRKGLRQ